MTHFIKTERPYFNAIRSGKKKFELRKNDRDYQLNDTLMLSEVIDGQNTGRIYGPISIDYIFHGGSYGLPIGYCIICWEQFDDIPF